MKKVFFGLLVAALAVGGSAFTNAKFAAVTYGQVSNGNYVKLTSLTGDCSEELPTTTPCQITYESDPGLSSFTYATKPVGGTESLIKRIYVP